MATRTWIRAAARLIVTMIVACATGAHAATAISLDSEPGDYVGGGGRYTLTTADGTISATRSQYGPGVRVDYVGVGVWTLNFVGPDAAPFVPGNYEKASRAPFKAPNLPGLEVDGDFRGCNALTGRFTVREIEFGANDQVVKFAADFVQYCDGSGAALRGAVRFNSAIAIAPPAPIAVAGARQSVTEGDTVMLDGGASYDLDGHIISYKWLQLAGPAMSLADDLVVRTTFVAPQVGPGGAIVVLQLTVTDNNGNIGSDNVTIAVRDVGDPRSLIYFNSQPGEYIGGGVQRTVTEDSGTFRAGPMYNWGDLDRGVEIAFQGGQVWWNLEFGSVANAGRLQPGIYRFAERAAFASPGHPGLDVFGDGRGCNNVRGRFDVLEVAYGPSGEILRFAADFEQHCENLSPVLFGSVRFRSAAAVGPRPPSAYANGPARQPEGAGVTLDATASIDPQQSPLSFIWAQEAGPAVTLTGAATASAAFVTPTVPLGGADLVFSVTVTNALGLVDVARTTVHVVAKGDPRSLLDVKSIPGDPVGLGGTYALYDWDGTFSSFPRQGSFVNGVEVQFFDGGFANYWRLEFAPANGAGPLQPGVYAPAGPAGYSPAPLPGLGIWESGGSCPAPPAGRFTILEAEYGNAGTIDDLKKFAVDFVQRCGPSAFPLFGSLRLNSAVPVGPRVPSATATAPARVPSGATVTLDSTGSADALDAHPALAWSQIAGPVVTLSDPTAAKPSFVAPAVPSGGADLGFRVTVTNAFALTDLADVVVHVVAPGDSTSILYIKSQPGDPVGAGKTEMYAEWDGAFAGFANSGAAGVAFRSSEYWAVTFYAPSGANRLQVGDYRDVGSPFSGTPGRPAIAVLGPYGSCYSDVTGRFNIREIEYGPGGDLLKLAADFDQRCSNATGQLFGSVRLNSAVPLGPRAPSAYASAPPRILEGFEAVLDASGSGDPIDSLLRFRWTQIGGPPARLQDASLARARFNAPSVSPGGANLSFQVEVVNGLGLRDSTIVTVHVLDKSDAKTVLYLDSRPGSVGGGKTWTFYEWDGIFAQGGYGTSRDNVTVAFHDDAHDWTLAFGAPSGVPLTTGLYQNAQRLAFADPANPGMDVSGDHLGCNTISGSFRIHEIGPPSDRLSHLAIDFEQRCDPDAQPLYGSLRINSAIPVTIVPYTSFTARSGTGFDGVETSFSGGGTSCRLDNPHWLPPPPGSGEVPPTAPAANVLFPHGLLAFATDGCKSASNITVTIRFPFPLPPGLVYWKYGPTPDNRALHWYVLPATVAGNVVTFSIVDGGFGDDDLAANGRIVDVGGLGTAVGPISAPAPPSSIPTLSPLGLALLALVLAGIASLRRARPPPQRR